jgi:hypothetical protein
MGKYHDVEWIHAFEHELSLPGLIIHGDVKKLSWV